MPSTDLNVKVSENLDTQKIEDLQKICNVRILVGFPSGRQHIDTIHMQSDDGKSTTASIAGNETTAELAKELHFGSAKMKPRPFLDDGLESNRESINNMLYAQVTALMKGQQPNWDKVGTLAVGVIQEFVRSDFYKKNAPNRPKTIEEKGSDTPLIDGGDLINSLAYIVEDK